MPVVSKAQNRYVHARAENPKGPGMSKAVAEEFIASEHGKSLKGLPERVKKAEGGSVGYPRTFKW